MTLDMFTPSEVVGQEAPSFSSPSLRPYQQAALEAVEHELAKPDVRGTLVVMATGTGKTILFVKAIARRKGRCLILAHRDELIQQAARKVEAVAGVFPDIEQAGSAALAKGDRPVIASVQTLSRPNRLGRFSPDAFDLIVIDEAHHCTANSWKSITDYFGPAKLLGVTATPDRADGEALGQLFDSVAYTYDLHTAIADGYLAPIVMRRVMVAGLDFSKVKTTAGDLNQKELEAVISEEEILHGIAKPTIEIAGDRKTIVFAPGVKSAHRLAELIDRYTERGRACVVDGETDTDTRRSTLAAFGAGDHQFLVNVGIATEGYDEPAVSCVVMARPTKSRSLYAQMAGRGTRGGPQCPIPGKIDCLLVDFVGNTGRHDIVSAADILGGKVSERDLARAKRVMDKTEEPMSLEFAVEEVQRQDAERKAMIEEAMKRRRAPVKADVSYLTEEADPYLRKSKVKTGPAGMSAKTFAEFQKLMGEQHAARWLRDNPSPDPTKISTIMTKLRDREQAGLASNAQRHFFRKKGLDATRWTKKGASRVFEWVKANGWATPSPQTLARLLQRPT